MGGTICRTRHPDQVSRSMIPLPYFFVNQFIKSAEIAEDILGHPPTVLQICKILEENYNCPLGEIMQVAAIFASLLREDIVYTDKICYRWTVRKQEGFFNYSEIFAMRYGVGYLCDPKGRVYPTTARTISFTHLKQVLLSKDQAQFNENKWIWDGEFRFLDNKEQMNE